MEHTKIVTANELEDFANRRDSEAVIPELVFQLVNQSVPDLGSCRIPYDESVGLPGYDGRVESTSGFRQFVPQGVSYWEIGRSADAQGKATRDYGTRLAETTAEERAAATYVFVTPRSRDWDPASQDSWIRRRQGDGWKQLKIIDGIQLCDWVREFPAIGKWLMRQIGLPVRPTGLVTPAEHWDNLSSLCQAPDPPLPPELFLAGREIACQNLDRLFKSEIFQLVLAAESEGDAEDLVAAFLLSLDEASRREWSGRCLFISEPDTWSTFAELRTSHVLVASARLDLESGEGLHLAARRNGHRVILPLLGASEFGGQSLVQIRSPSRAAIEQLLLKRGFSSERAEALALVGAKSLWRLKRHLRGLGDVPPYAASPNARFLMQANLIGRWSEDSVADKEALESFLGKSYGEWIDAIHVEARRSDAPLIRRNDAWKIVARSETWGALASRVTEEDLDRFAGLAVRVLGELDPQFELPKDERYAAGVYKKVPAHSRQLRHGVAETLALLGARGKALISSRPGKGEAIAAHVVSELLQSHDWRVWAGLSALLPLLAEAAPRQFLDAVESAVSIDAAENPFRRMFAEEGGGPLGGQSYMSGVLWGMETLAWNADYLARVTSLLGDLAAIDPGGTWANRPKNSLVDIFLPWHVQTVASRDQRKAALESLRRDHPDIAWDVLLGLLPRAHGFTGGTRRPTWQEFVPADWVEAISAEDYWVQVADYAGLCVSMAAGDVPKLVQLIDRLADLPEAAYSTVLAHLSSPEVTGLNEQKRVQLWEALKDFVANQRRFDRSTPAQIERLEAVVRGLEPSDFGLASRRYFTVRDWDLFEERDDVEEQSRHLQEVRRGIVRRMLESAGVDGVRRFAASVEAPRKVGDALGSVAEPSVDELLLNEMIDSEDLAQKELIAAFVWRRFTDHRWAWADRLLTAIEDQERRLSFLLMLPADPDVWRRAEELLGDQSNRYWSEVRIYPWGMEAEDLLEATRKLIGGGQPEAAVECLYLLAHKKVTIPIEVAAQALIGAVESSNRKQDAMDPHHIVEIVTWLQQCEPSDSEDVFRIEWMYLPALKRVFGGEPRVLERRLATSPEFFCQIVAAVFRSEKESNEPREISDVERRVAQNAYSLLHEWRTLPGMSANGEFEADIFNDWLRRTKILAEESGHLRIALDQLGQALAYAPADPAGLWIHRDIAAALDAKDAAGMRRAFTAGLFNLRGIHGFSHGEEERRLALQYKQKARALADAGFHRVADAVQRLAEDYDRDADKEAQRDPFE